MPVFYLVRFNLEADTHNKLEAEAEKKHLTIEQLITQILTRAAEPLPEPPKKKSPR